MKLLQAIRARDAAKDKLAAAKTATARTAALADLDKASMALARAQIKAGVRADEDEPKKPLADEEEKSLEDDSDSAEEEEEEEEEKSKSKSKSPMEKKTKAEEEEEEEEEDEDSDSDSDSDDSGDSAEEDKVEEKKAEEEDEDSAEEEDEDSAEDKEDKEEEEEEKAKTAALASARQLRTLAKKSGDKKMFALARKNVADLKKATSAKSVSSLRQIRATAQKLTGQKSTKKVLGALAGFSTLPAEVERLSASAAKSRVKERKERVSKLLTENRGRFASSEREQLFETAMKLGTKWLRANLSARPKNIRTLSEGPVEGKSYSATPPQKKAEKQFSYASMDADQRSMVNASAASAGMTPEEYVELMNDPQKQVRKAAGKNAG